MPKLRQAFPGGALLPLLEKEIKAFFATRTENFTMSRNRVRGFVLAAAYPYMVGEDRPPARKVHFAEDYAMEPDFFLAFMTLLRGLLANESKRFQIQKFLVTNIFGQDSYGKPDWTCDMSAGDIAANLPWLKSKALDEDDVRNAEMELRKIYRAPQADFFLTGAAQKAIRESATEKDRRHLLKTHTPPKSSVIVNRKIKYSAQQIAEAKRNSARINASVRNADIPEKLR